MNSHIFCGQLNQRDDVIKNPFICVSHIHCLFVSIDAKGFSCCFTYVLAACTMGFQWKIRAERNAVYVQKQIHFLFIRNSCTNPMDETIGFICNAGTQGGQIFCLNLFIVLM